MRKFNSFLIVFFIAGQCMAQPKAEKINTASISSAANNQVSTDDLVSNWNAAWNKNDSAAIVSLMDNDIQVISGRLLLSGKEDACKKFVSRNYKLLADLKTEKIKSFTDGSLAYQTGRYTHHVKGSNTIVEGTYSFVWNKLPDNQWKLKVAEIEQWPAEK